MRDTSLAPAVTTKDKDTIIHAPWLPSSLYIVILLVLSLWLPGVFNPLVANAQTGSEERDVNSFRIKIRRLQQGISRQENKILLTERREESILAEIEVLDKKLSEQQLKLSELRRKMDHQQQLIDREEAALRIIRHEKSIVQDHLKKRITAYYTMGDIGLLNVTFSTRTLPELLTFHDAFNTLIKYDQDVIDVYRETIDELERVTNTLALEKTILEEFITQTLEEKDILERTKQEKKSLLTHVRTQTRLHQQAIEEMQQATRELANTIIAIKSKNQSFERTFETAKGSLPPPVDGVLLTLFGQEKVNKLGIKGKSDGIELKAPEGTDIVAVNEGDVIFAGYLRGYGNTVIIHHGFQYYTVTSRIDTILVQKGQHVDTESPIGIMGITATLFDEGLYFEIRHGKNSLDPLVWLNPNRLSAPAELDLQQEQQPPASEQ